MANQQIVDYIKGQLQAGVKKEDIRVALISNGWNISDIDEAFKEIISDGLAPQPQSVSNSPQIKSNLWIASTILANQIIVGIIAFACLFIVNVIIRSLPLSNQFYIYLIFELILFLSAIYSIWLGVKSARKKTGIDPQNYFRIILYWFSLIFQCTFWAGYG